MFGSIGFPEIILILVVALLIFGPKKLPEFAKTVGKALREFRRTVNEAKSTIEEEIEKADETGDLKNIKQDIQELDQDIKQLSRLDFNMEENDEQNRKRKPK
jgi:TatA/E family protein of Tat protein translocase